MWRIVIVAVLLGTVLGYKTPSGSYVKPIDKIKEDSPITTISTLIGSSMATSSSTTRTTRTTTTPSTTTAAITSTSHTTRIPSSESTSEPSSSPQPLTSTTAQAVSVAPTQDINSESPPSLIAIDNNEGIEEPYRRRVITYDQRQEGQYNIRADLENFMIVLIPPSPMEGASLLDLLTKSSWRRSSATNSGKAKRRHPYADVAASEGFHPSLKTGNKNQNFHYFNRGDADFKGINDPEAALQRYRQHQDVPYAGSKRFQELIEGRSPFLVDLALTRNIEHTRHQPDRQVDVLPPHYPLAYQHLITPFHLEAEPTIIQALPPTGVAGQSTQGASNFLETYNQLLSASNLQGSSDEALQAPAKATAPEESDFYRVSRAIRSDNLLDTNSVALSNSLSSGSSDGSFYHRSSNVPIFRSDLSFGTAALYPPIDAPRLTGYLNVGSTSRTLSLNSAEESDFDDAHVGEIIVPSPSGDELDFGLNSDSFINSEAKRLLSDGLERCAPGRRRDSYGVCREIEGY